MKSKTLVAYRLTDEAIRMLDKLVDIEGAASKTYMIERLIRDAAKRRGIK